MFVPLFLADPIFVPYELHEFMDRHGMKLLSLAGIGSLSLLSPVSATPFGAGEHETNRAHTPRTNPNIFMTAPIVKSAGEYGKIFPQNKRI